MASRQLNRFECISTPPPYRPGPRPRVPTVPSPLQNPGFPPLYDWRVGARLAAPSRLPPLVLSSPSPSSGRLSTSSPLTPPQGKTKTNTLAPRTSDSRTPRPGSGTALAAWVGEGTSPRTPTPRSSVTLRLALRLPRPSPTPPPNGETSQKRAEKKFQHKVGPLGKRGASAGSGGREGGRAEGSGARRAGGGERRGSLRVRVGAGAGNAR